MGFCAVMFVVCLADLCYLISSFKLLPKLFGSEEIIRGCSGRTCFEVATCRGLSDSSYRAHEPFFTLVGLVIFPLGVHACHVRHKFQVQVLTFALYTFIVIHIGVAIFNVIYFGACSAYTLDVVQKSSWHLRPAEQERLSKLTYFPVDEISIEASILFWSVCADALWFAVLALVAREARLMSKLFETGLLGIGMNYKIGWDERLSYENVLKKSMNKNSVFMHDVETPLVEAHNSRMLGYRYGAVTEKDSWVITSSTVSQGHWDTLQQAWEDEFGEEETDMHFEVDESDSGKGESIEGDSIHEAAALAAVTKAHDEDTMKL